MEQLKKKRNRDGENTYPSTSRRTANSVDGFCLLELGVKQNVVNRFCCTNFPGKV